MMRKKPYIQEHKTTAEKQLAERVQTLQAEGVTEGTIRRDTQVRHYRGKIRQATQQLAGIAELEKQMAHKAEIKAEKMALPKTEPPKKRHSANPEMKKIKKERKVVVETDE